MLPSSVSADAVDALLPQTQCTRCGYPDCAAYANAIAREDAPINRCPPGGDTTIAALAALTGRARTSVDPGCGDGGLSPLALRVAGGSAHARGAPVGCITMRPVDGTWDESDAAAARARHRAREARLARGERIAERGAPGVRDPAGDPQRERRQATVAAALERARARRANLPAAS